MIETPEAESITVATDEGKKPQHRTGKVTSEQRIRELVAARNGLRQQLDEAERKLGALKIENELLTHYIDGLESKAIDPVEYRRLKDLEARLEAYYAWRRDAIRQVAPDYDACCSRLADLPTDWIREISLMPNGPELILFFGRGKDLLECLKELKPEAALKRIRQAAFDVPPYTHTSKRSYN
jgi:hypothetical protein